jgi:hypothetical protein
MTWSIIASVFDRDPGAAVRGVLRLSRDGTGEDAAHEDAHEEPLREGEDGGRHHGGVPRWRRADPRRTRRLDEVGNLHGDRGRPAPGTDEDQQGEQVVPP